MLMLVILLLLQLLLLIKRRGAEVDLIRLLIVNLLLLLLLLLLGHLLLLLHLLQLVLPKKELLLNIVLALLITIERLPRGGAYTNAQSSAAAPCEETPNGRKLRGLLLLLFVRIAAPSAASAIHRRALSHAGTDAFVHNLCRGDAPSAPSPAKEEKVGILSCLRAAAWGPRCVPWRPVVASVLLLLLLVERIACTSVG